MVKQILEILVGMIASGKSTYARLRAGDGALVVNHDTIVDSLHGGDYTLYNSGLGPVYKTIELQMIMAALSTGRDVIVDRTNLDRKRRARYIQLADMFKVPAVCTLMEFDDPRAHASRRVVAGARGVSRTKWIEVAEFHLDEYQEPKLDEGLDRIQVVNWPDLARGAIVHREV